MNSIPYINDIPKLVSLLSLISYFVIAARILKEDREKGKIPNKDIILGMKIVFILLFINLLNSVLGKMGYNKSYLTFIYYKFYFINFLYSFIFSYILWYGEIWPAGDSKFFILNILFLPLINFNLNGFPHYLWISLLVNIFIVSAFVSIFIYIKQNISLLHSGDSDAFSEVKKIYFEKLKKINFKSPRIYLSILSIFALFTYKQMVNLFIQNYIIKIFHRTDIFFFILFFLWPKISSFFKTKYWKFILIFLYLILFLTTLIKPDPLEYIKTITKIALLNSLKFSAILFIAKTIFEDILESSNTYCASKQDINEGMVLHSAELQIIKENPIFKGLFDDCFKDGLNSEQVNALKDWLSRLPQQNPKLRFVKTKPFAFYIFLGSIIQMIINKNIIKYFLQ